MTSNEQEFSIISKEEMSPIVLKTELKAEYLEETDDIEDKMYLFLSTDQIRSGLIKNLGNDKVKNKGASAVINFSVLLVIASHMNSKGKAFPSQRRIAAATGLSRATVAKAIGELQEIQIGGQPVLGVIKEKNIRNLDKNIYSLTNTEMPDDIGTVLKKERGHI